MPAIVTIMKSPRFEPHSATVVATYSFDDPEQAKKVVENFGYHESEDGSEVVSAELNIPRDGNMVHSLHMANSIKLAYGSYFEQTQWLVSDAEVEVSGTALKAAFDDHEAAYAEDADGNIVKLDSTYKGDLVFYSFNPFICEKLNRELTLGY